MAYTTRTYEDTRRIIDNLPPLNAPLSTADNEVDSESTSLHFIGEDVLDYSSYVNENFTWLLENFAGQNPPASPVLGQLWYREMPNGTDEYYVHHPDYNGEGDDWLPILADSRKQLNDHLNATNPHLLNKVDLGLNLVDNVLLFDRTLNLSDLYTYEDNIPKADIARDNLELYSKQEVYTKIESDELFLSLLDPAGNTDLLDGFTPDAFAKYHGPEFTGTLDANDVTYGSLASTATQNAMISVNDPLGGELGFSTGINRNSTLYKNNTSGTRMRLSSNNNDSNFGLVTYGQGNINSTPMPNNTLTFSLGVLTIDNGEVFYRTNPPTPLQCDSYAVDETVDNAILLNGIDSSVGDDPNTIAARNSNGNVYARTFIDGRASSSPGTNANIAFRRNSTTDVNTRFTHKDNVPVWLGLGNGINRNLIVAAGRFSGLNGGATSNILSTISRIGKGHFRVTFSTPMPNTKYCPIIGQTDEGSIYSNKTKTDYAIMVNQAWVSTRQTTYFDIKTKQVYSDYRSSSGDPTFVWTEMKSKSHDIAGYISYAVYS